MKRYLCKEKRGQQALSISNSITNFHLKSIQEEAIRATHRENSVRHPRKSYDKNVTSKVVDKTSANVADVPRQRGFINFSAAKERQKSQFAAGRAR